MESLSLGISPQIVHDCQNGQLVIVVMHGILKSTHVRSFLTCSSCLFNPWCERYLKENSSSPQIVGVVWALSFCPASVPALCVCYQRKRRKMEQNLEQNLSTSRIGNAACGI